MEHSPARTWLGAALFWVFGAVVMGEAFAALSLIGMAGALALLAATKGLRFGSGVLSSIGTSRFDTGSPYRLLATGGPLLEAPQASGAQVAGRREGQSVRIWTERAERRGALQLNCSVRAARGEVYLTGVSASDLGVEATAAVDDLVIRLGGLRAVWTTTAPLSEAVCRPWIESMLTEADARRVPQDRYLERLVELAEDGRGSVYAALDAAAPDHPQLSELADRLAQLPAPAARIIGARWQGPNALEALVDALADEPVWQARALRARSEADELPPAAVQRWTGAPGLRLELLIDQARRGPVDVVHGLVSSAPTWAVADEARAEALAGALIGRGPAVERAAQWLFSNQPIGRAQWARALGEIGGVQSLGILRGGFAAGGWPEFTAEEDAIERAIARLTHRLGDGAAGMLTLEQPGHGAGGLSLGDRSAGGLAVAGPIEGAPGSDERL